MVENFVSFCSKNFNLNSTQSSYSYYSLPICLIDSIYSLRTRYFSVCVPIINRYASTYLQGNNKSKDDNLTKFINNINNIGGCEEFANNILKNKQKLSGRLKSEICYELAQKLLMLNINTLKDFQTYPDSVKLENTIKSVKGIGNAGSNYLFMLAGDSNRCKPDVHIHHSIIDACGKDVSDDDCQKLFTNAVTVLKKDFPNLTVRQLDSIIWKYYQAKKG